MTKEEFSQIATVKDLELFHEKIINDVKGLIFNKRNPQKEFYSPKEFSGVTGMSIALLYTAVKWAN